MEEFLKKMCEDMIEMLYMLRDSGKITESEFKKHLKNKNEFLEVIKK